MRMTIKELMERLAQADQDAEVVLITRWGHPTYLDQVHMSPDMATLSGNVEYDGPGMPYV